MPDVLHEVHAHPSTWDGVDADVRVGLFTSREKAEQAFQDWLAVPRNRYPYMMGEWVARYATVPVDKVIVR